MSHSPKDLTSIEYVTGASRLDVLSAHLARSSCFSSNRARLTIAMNASSAAQAFNDVLVSTKADWLVWVHQDVYLPDGWDALFSLQLQRAIKLWPDLAVAGVYGVNGSGASAQHAGHVLDRGNLLAPNVTLPCWADSLDELLVAVRVSSGLRMDPDMGFDFYATDLTLQAKTKGLQCAVLDAYCEHWSDTPNRLALTPSLATRILRNAEAFERKWVHKMPISTTCFDIRQLGDVKRFLEGGEAHGGVPA